MTNSSSSLSTIDSFSLLRDLPEAWRLRLAAGARSWRAEAGALVFEVGDPCQDLALLAAGAVRVVKPLTTGQEILLYRLHPNELCIISTSCLLGNAAYPVRGIVDGQAHGVMLAGSVVRQAVAACRPFRELVFASLAERLAGLMALGWTAVWPPSWSSTRPCSIRRISSWPRSWRAPAKW